MNAFANAIKDITADKARTENGATVYASSGSEVLDLFFGIGAVRTATPNDIIKMASVAFEADPELATRVMFWARDVRGGAGERRSFRIVSRWLATNEKFKDIAEVILFKTPEFGRWDDVFYSFFDTPLEGLALDFVAQNLANGDKLLAKWIPRKGPINAKIRKHLKINEATLRRILVELTNVVETQMCAKDWESIKFSNVPSVAMARYTKAFYKHQPERFGSYISSVTNGTVNKDTGKIETINTGAIYPYDVCKKSLSADAAQALWQNLPNYIPEGSNFIPLIDTSGSMGMAQLGSSLSALDVAVSLGIYMAERNTSVFKDHWINFSTNPQFYTLKGNTIREKIDNLDYRNWHGSTNLEKAFRLILDTAIKNNVPQDEMPKTLVILSDMEFNSFQGGQVDTAIEDLFQNAGYKRPDIVWWNIAQRSAKSPVRAHSKGMSLVSGFSPSVAETVLGNSTTPYEMMLKVIMKEKYDPSK